MSLTLSPAQLARLSACRHCGIGPRGVPLGEFCPASDPDDRDFHDFSPAQGSPDRTPFPPVGWPCGGADRGEMA